MAIRDSGFSQKWKKLRNVDWVEPASPRILFMPNIPLKSTGYNATVISIFYKALKSMPAYKISMSFDSRTTAEIVATVNVW